MNLEQGHLNETGEVLRRWQLYMVQYLSKDYSRRASRSPSASSTHPGHLCGFFCDSSARERARDYLSSSNRRCERRYQGPTRIGPSGRDHNPDARHPGTSTTEREKLLACDGPPRRSPPTSPPPNASMPRPCGPRQQLLPIDSLANGPTADPRVRTSDPISPTSHPVRGSRTPPIPTLLSRKVLLTSRSTYPDGKYLPLITLVEGHEDFATPPSCTISPSGHASPHPAEDSTDWRGLFPTHLVRSTTQATDTSTHAPASVAPTGRGASTNKAPPLALELTPTPASDARWAGTTFPASRPPSASLPPTGAPPCRPPTVSQHGLMKPVEGPAMTPSSLSTCGWTLPFHPSHTIVGAIPLSGSSPETSP